MIGTSTHTRLAGALAALVLFGAASTASTASADVVTAGLTGYWTFDDATPIDALGAHSATVYGAPITGAPGQDGSAFVFNGAGDGITIDNHDQLLSPGGGDFTVSMWFRMDAPSNALLFMNYSGLVYYGVYAEPDGTLVAFARDSARRFSEIDGHTSLLDGKWHHMAYVRAGSVFTLYLDCGVEAQDTEIVGSVTGTTPWIHVASANTGCQGCTTNANGVPNAQYFAGAIDDLAFYNRALSSDDVAQNGTSKTIVCGCAIATACSGGQNCGTASDNCGGTLECGTCSGPDICGADNICACTPATSCPAGLNCGTAPDGCGGTLQCGTCAQTCSANGSGGASCTCGTGYILDGDHRSCDDIAPPTVTITAPLPAANLYAHNGTALMGVAIDTGSGVASASFSIDGTTTVAATSTGGSVWTGVSSFNLSSLSYGTHTVTLTAVDHAGNHATSASVSFIVAAPPSVVFITPLNGQQASGSEDIVVDAASHGYNLSSVKITATSSTGGTHSAICTAAGATGALRCTWSQLNVGSYCPALVTILGLSVLPQTCAVTLSAVATDSSGQTGSAVAAISVIPASTVIATANNANGLSITVTNLNLSYNHVQCSVDGVNLPTAIALGGTASMIYPNPPAGPLLVICDWTTSGGSTLVDSTTLPHPTGGVVITGQTPILSLIAILL